MLTPSMVSVMSNDDKCFVCGQVGHFGHHCPNAQCCSCNEFSHFGQGFPNNIPPLRNHATKTGLLQGNDTPTYKGTDDTPPTVGIDMGDISTDQSCHCPHHGRSSNSFRRHTPCISSSHCRWFMSPFG